MAEVNQEDQTQMVADKQVENQSSSVAVEGIENTSQPESQVQQLSEQNFSNRSVFHDLLEEELSERSLYGVSRPSVLAEMMNRRSKYASKLAGTSAYSVEEHMAIARRNYGVPPEIVYGAAKWIGCDSFTEETMRQLVKAYSEREV